MLDIFDVSSIFNGNINPFIYTNPSSPALWEAQDGAFSSRFDKDSFEVLEQIVERTEVGRNFLNTRKRLSSNELLQKIRDEITNINSDLYHALQEITEIDLSLQRISFLPPEICQLVNLQSLNISHTEIDTLPSEISQLTNLTNLDLSYSKIISLPPEMNNLLSLKRLDLINLEFTSFPLVITELTTLTFLDLQNTHIDSVPPEISNLINLITLELNGTQIRSLPEEISLLRNLEILNLKGANITSLPERILNLPAACEVSITATNLSREIRNRLTEMTSVEEYNGPVIHFDMIENDNQEEKTTEEILREFYKSTETPIPLDLFPRLFEDITSNDTEEDALNIWLNRLSYMADFKDSSSRKNELIHKILSYLERADCDEEFRPVFMETIKIAAETCGDRMALSILHLGLNHQLHTANLKDFKSLKNLLKGVWGVDLLEHIARSKIKGLNFVDEIEVYLGYPVMLKNELNLPIDVNKILYFWCSAITKEELIAAKEIVEGHYNNRESLVDFLIKHEKWQEALYLESPELKELIPSIKLESFTDDIDHSLEVEQAFYGKLKIITHNILSALDKEN